MASTVPIDIVVDLDLMVLGGTLLVGGTAAIVVLIAGRFLVFGWNWFLR